MNLFYAFMIHWTNFCFTNQYWKATSNR